MKYVALIRGINVGGKNIIKMEALRSSFLNAGFVEVSTFIQSGNVFFETEIEDIEHILQTIEGLLQSDFQCATNVVVKSSQEIEKIIFSFPKIFENPDYKHNVAFLREEIDDKKLLQKFIVHTEIDEVSYAKGVLFMSTNKAQQTSSRLVRIIKKKEYKLMTIRNLNTTKKLWEIFQGK